MTRALGTVLLCLAACSPDAGWDTLPESMPVAEAGPPTFLDAGMAIPGHPMTLTAAVSPGERVFFVAGPSVGAGPCPAPLMGSCLDVVDARLVGASVGDATGKASIVFDVENAAPVGSTLAFQTVVLGNVTAFLGDALEVEVAAPGDVCQRMGLGVWNDVGANEECEALIETNIVRAEGYDCGNGMLPPTHPLTMNEDLRYAARTHAEWMRNGGGFGHSSVGGPLGDTLRSRVNSAGYRWRKIGENVARGRYQGAVTVDAWLNSQGHCRTLMNSEYVDVGYGRSHGNGKVYWTGDYGKPR